MNTELIEAAKEMLAAVNGMYIEFVDRAEIVDKAERRLRAAVTAAPAGGDDPTEAVTWRKPGRGRKPERSGRKTNMADYYTKVSLLIEGTAEQLDALMALLMDSNLECDEDEDCEDEDDEHGHGCEFSREAGGVWVHSENANLEDLASVLAGWMAEQAIDRPIGFEFSSDASKPLLDAYGGGACYIHPLGGDTEWISTSRWLAERTPALPCAETTGHEGTMRKQR